MDGGASRGRIRATKKALFGDGQVLKIINAGSEIIHSLYWSAC